MNVSVMMLAPYAELSEEGKVSVIGGDIDLLRVQARLPAATGLPLYLLIKIIFPPNECGRQYLARVEMVAPDGTVILTTERPVHPPALPDNRSAKVGINTAFQGIDLPAAGNYSIRLFIDGREVQSLPLYVEEIPQNP